MKHANAGQPAHAVILGEDEVHQGVARSEAHGQPGSKSRCRSASAGISALVTGNGLKA